MRNILLVGVAFAALAAGGAQAQMSDNVIKIGMLSDRSGIYADINGEGSAVAARMAAEEFGNAINGTKVEIIVGDHQNKADIAANLARQWIDTERVDVVADVPNSAAALAVQSITRDKKRLFLMSGPGSTDLTGKECSPYGFQWTWDNHSVASATARALVEQGKKSWFFITADYAFGHSLEIEAANTVKQLGGTMMKDAKVADNGRVFDDMYLLQVKTPGEAKYAWDYFKILKKIPGDQAYIAPKDSGCPLVK